MSRRLVPDEADLKSSIPNSTSRKLYIVFDGQDGSAPQSGEDNSVEFERTDIADSIKRTFATYNNHQTAINQFQIQDSVRNFRSYDAFGNQSNFLQHDADEQKSFLGEFAEDNEAARNFEKSYSGLLNTDGSEFNLNKTFQGPGLSEGDKILKNPSTFAVRINAVLEDNNRNNPNNNLVGTNTQTEDEFVLGSISFKKLGEAGNKRKFPKVIEGSSKDSLTIKELKTMGLLTMLQATGEINQPNISDSNAQDAIASYGISTTMAPGVSRIGGRINVSRFSATNVIKAIKPDYNKQEHTNFINGKAVYSYGNVNSYFVPFDGLTNVPSVISATILFSTVVGALSTLSLLSLVRSGTKEITTGGDTENRRQWLGKYKISPSNSTGNISNILLNQKNILEFVPIEHEFFKCLNKGITVFFGMPGIRAFGETNIASSLGTNIVAGASQLTKLNGYYNTILRNVVRDINNLAFNPFENTESRTPDAMDIRNNADPVAMVKKLNNSSLMKLINILLTIGDKALLVEDKQISSSEGLGFLTNSDIDTIEEQLGSEFAILPNTTTINPSILRVKNRLKNGHLAMSNGTLKSMYLMPSNIMQTIGKISDAGNVGKFKSRLQNNNIVVERSQYISNNRIKAEIVKKMEDYLELDYLPFYFHDIRTNEITSFHAFIENINDSISAEYVETEGYGRVGKIHTYKNTNRDISFSFKLFATNDTDFDDMWVKINKLGTLLYPQWTEGRKINFPSTNGQTYKFIQPFSQLPGASPLVRIRVGDLFKTNYSKLAVARLFGFGNGINEGGSFNIQGMDREAERVGRESTQRMQTEQRANEIFDQQRRGIFSPGSSVKLRACNGRFQATDREFRFQEGYTASVLALNGHVVSLSNNGAIFTTQVENIVPDIELIKRDIASDTNISSETQNTTQSEQNNSRQNSETINTFFDPDRNYIMKAFESTKGRGLAGFIKSFKLNFENATWMTDLVNCRAPKLVTIDVDFSPIHDIQPGLDSNGFMTAPIWNVGKTIGELSDQNEFRKVDENIKTATSYITPSYARQGSDNNAADQRSLSERITRTTLR